MALLKKYKCDYCEFESEFLDQEIWEVIMPVGWSGKPLNSNEVDSEEHDKPYKLSNSKRHICLECGLKVYHFTMKLKGIE